jgi:mycothiol synthase
MELTSRPFDPEEDSPAVAALFDGASAATRHVVDFPWRLSSPDAESGRGARLWWTDDGRLVGFAAWQSCWAVLDLVVSVGCDRPHIESAMLDWAEQRFAELDAERGYPLPYWIEAYADDAERLAWLRTRGYQLDDENRYIELTRSLADPVPVAILPDSFLIRPLGGDLEVADYVEAHRAAFGSASMTLEWRLRTLRMPNYAGDLDLIAEGPDGHMAGFCVGWLAAGRRTGQIEPIGVVPSFRQRGLGRALLAEMLRRFRDFGADIALVETDSIRSPALHLYEAMGFRRTRTAVRAGKWISR